MPTTDAPTTILDRLRTIGGRLEISRMNADYTQEFVARHLDKPQSWVAKIESNERRLLFSEAMDLARLYSVSVAEFDPDAPMGQRFERFAAAEGALPEGAISERLLDRCLAVFAARSGLRMEPGPMQRATRGPDEVEERFIHLAKDGQRVESGFSEFVYPDGRNFALRDVGELLRRMAGPVRRADPRKPREQLVDPGLTASRRRSQADHRALRTLLGRSAYAELVDIFLHGPSLDLLHAADEAIGREMDEFDASQEFGAGLNLDAEAIAAAFPTPMASPETDDFATPRTMVVLALALSQTAYDIDFESGLVTNDAIEIRRIGNGEIETESSILYRLPAPTYEASYAWRLRLSQAAADLASDIVAGREPQPRCPGEEAALLLALDTAAYMTDDDEGEAWYGPLPEVVNTLLPSKGDYEWDALEEQFCGSGMMRDIFDEEVPPTQEYDPSAWFHWLEGRAPRENRDTDPSRLTASLMLAELPTAFD